MNTPSRPRIDARRPYMLTPLGRRRYAPGLVGTLDGAQTQNAAAPAPAQKPYRMEMPVQGCIMAVAHSERGVLPPGAQQAVAAAALLADPHCAVLLAVLGPLTESAAACGADQVIVLDEAVQFHPDHALRILEQLRQDHAPVRIVLSDENAQDSDLGRRLAARHGLTIATHVAEITADSVMAYQRHHTVQARRPLPDIMLIGPDCVDMRLPFKGRGEPLDWQPRTAPGTCYTDHGVTAVPASRLALEEADFIVAAGNGVHDLATFHDLAQAMDAAIGASRVAVDDGRFERAQQVGATGKTVASSVYIALGISGAVQHLQGIKDCRHVIAVNQDASAPMIKRADLSLIDDAQAVMRALIIEVRAARAASQGAGL